MSAADHLFVRTLVQDGVETGCYFIFPGAHEAVVPCLAAKEECVETGIPNPKPVYYVRKTMCTDQVPMHDDVRR